MAARWLLGLMVAGWMVSTSGSAALAADSEAEAAEVSLFRVFLQNGESLVSYGEFAHVNDRIVFSMPTSASTIAPRLQLVNVPFEQVDWPRTQNYAEAVRADRYLLSRAEPDYVGLTVEIERALDDVSVTDDIARRRDIIERVRGRLAYWPGAHYGYRNHEIQQMLGLLDEAIAEMRGATGASTFDLSLVAAGRPFGEGERLLPPPGLREAIEGTMAAAKATTTAAERESLLVAALTALAAESANLPSDWVAAVRSEALVELTREQELDRQYQSLADRLLPAATWRASAADVDGLKHRLDEIGDRGKALASVRPDSVASLVRLVEEQLDSARRLRLERDRWAQRASALRSYRAAIAPSLERLQQMKGPLEDIRLLAGSGPQAIGRVIDRAQVIRQGLATIDPPSDLRDAHALFLSAVQLADSAARIRREAALTDSMPRAWDASSAAAGSLMLTERARAAMQEAMRPAP